MIPAPLNFTSWVGDTVRLKLTLTDGSGVPLVLDGVSAAAQARQSKKDTQVLAEFQCSVSTTDPGVVDLLLPASKAATLPEGKFPWDLQLTFPAIGDDEPVVETYVAGIWTTTMDVTRVTA